METLYFEIQGSLPLFNIAPANPIDQRVELRVAIDSGPITFYSETGRIVSDVINYAAHLEKSTTSPGHISLSERTATACEPRMLSIFDEPGEFEGSPYRMTRQRLDALFADEESIELEAPRRRRSAS